MPEIKPNLTGYEKRIASEFPTLSRPQVRKTAKKIFWMAENMHEVLDFYEALKILGITSDPTPRDAIRNIEAVAA